MAENINFIPASELPITEAENVEVLCVENGELKKKPTATEYDLDVVINWDMANGDATTATHEIKNLAEYSVLKAKIEARNQIKSRVTFYATDNGASSVTNWFNDAVLPTVMPAYEETPAHILFYVADLANGMNWTIVVLPDNTVIVEFGG